MRIGYSVKHSIDLIDEICENPKQYKGGYQGVINDARVHYENGNASKGWYDCVVERLSNYTKR